MVNQSDLPVDQLVLKTIRQALKPLSIKELNNLIPQYSEITIRRAIKNFAMLISWKRLGRQGQRSMV